MRYWRCAYGVDQNSFYPSSSSSPSEENEQVIAISRVFDGSYETAVPTSCLVSVMAECPIVPMGIYEEAMIEMKKALDTIHCISVLGPPISALEMQERHKQRILSAQKENTLVTAAAGVVPSNSIFVKASSLSTKGRERYNSNGQPAKGKKVSNSSNRDNKGKKKKVQYAISEEQSVITEDQSEKPLKEKEEMQEQVGGKRVQEQEEDLFTSLTEEFDFPKKQEAKIIPLTPPPLQLQKPVASGPPVKKQRKR